MDWNTRGLIAVCALASLISGCGNGGVVAKDRTTSLTETPVAENPTPSTPAPEAAPFVDGSNALGFYSNGSIEAAGALPLEGPGYLKVFRLRKRNYATETMVRTIAAAAAAWRAQYPSGDRVQVADITDWNGGYLSGHASHQNGLDADFAYVTTNHIERDPNTSGAGGFKEQFVSGGTVTKNFDVERNWAILRNLVRQGNVGRIFVDPVIKNTFCKKAAAIDPTTPAPVRNEVLRRLRPLAHHADHFHLRIKCPPGHKKCLAQTEPPSATGCTTVASLTGDLDLRTPEQRADDELGEDEGE